MSRSNQILLFLAFGVVSHSAFVINSHRQHVHQKCFGLTKAWSAEVNIQDTISTLSFQTIVNAEENRINNNSDDEVSQIWTWSRIALTRRGEPEGLLALRELQNRIRLRQPLDFGTTSVVSRPLQTNHTIVYKYSNLVPDQVTEQIFVNVIKMQQRGWLSTNPDSVDALPSFHLNLVSNGVSIADIDNAVAEEDFDYILQELTTLVSPYVYNDLLPLVQDLLNTTSIRVADIFLRRYGDDVMEGISRAGLSAHYDVYSILTAVIAIDDSAREGDNGLYSTILSPSGKTSNHAALRRFFPLSRGDAVVHSWDILHGVDIEPGIDRTSLVVWFTTEEQLSNPTMISPWLSRHKQSDWDQNDIAQFVLASALESSVAPKSSLARDVDEEDDDIFKALRLESYEYQNLYLKSAARENTFALTRVGSLCYDEELLSDLLPQARYVIDKIQTVSTMESLPDGSSLAIRFWWEGAIRGNPNAQVALGDAIMTCLTSSSPSDEEDDNTRRMTDSEEDYLLVAGVLFALAAQQGNTHATEAIHRVIEYAIYRSPSQNGDTDHDYACWSVIQVAEAAGCVST